MSILEIWINKLADRIAERIVDEMLTDILHVLGDHVHWATEDERVAFHNAVDSLNQEGQESAPETVQQKEAPIPVETEPEPIPPTEPPVKTNLNLSPGVKAPAESGDSSIGGPGSGNA